MEGTRGNVANKVNDLKTTLVPKMTQCRSLARAGRAKFLRKRVKSAPPRDPDHAGVSGFGNTHELPIAPPPLPTEGQWI
jgi:hypothetical protein